MKKIMRIGVIVCGLGWMVLCGEPCRAQSFELQQLLLDIQKLAGLKSILKDLQEGYKVLDAGYSAIRDVSKGSFNLHKAYLDGLLAVSPAVRNYARVADILSLQVSMVQRYKAAWARFSGDRHFSVAELGLMSQVYGSLLDQSAKDLEALAEIITDGSIRASDAERLRQIDGIYGGMAKRSAFLDQVNNSGALLSAQREKEENELGMTKRLYGVTP
jgi:hypothetical protein